MKLTVLKNNVPIDEIRVDTPRMSDRYEIFVGRSEDCHVRLDDPLISRHHFVIRNTDTEWLCEKLTLLGTVMVNGSTSSPLKLSNGDEIKCGQYSFLVNELPEGAPQIVEEEVSSLPSASEVSPISAPVAEEEVEAATTVEEMLPQDDLGGIDTSEEVTEEPLGEPDELSASEESFELEQDGFGGDDITYDENNSELSGENLSGDFASQDDNTSDFGNTTDIDSSLNNSDFEESTKVFQGFLKYQLILFGEHAPYDKYLIDADEIFIGRDAKKCQIVLNDPEVSSVHAVLKKTQALLTLEDLNSSNGTILNGSRINKSTISTGDEFVIGGTSFTLEVQSDLLEAEADRLMPVARNQVIEKEEIEEIEVDAGEDGLDFATEATQEKSIIKRILKDPQARKKAVYAIVGVGLAVVLFYEPSEELPQSTKKEPTQAEVETTKPKVQLSKELESRRNIAYELGVSFFEQNKYFEALREFQTVAEIDPDYKKIQTYLEQTKVALKRLEELEAQKRAEEDRIRIKKQVEELLVKAREAVKERQAQLAENYFSQIVEKDPENIEVQQLRMELEAWQKEESRKALERAAKEAARKRMVDALSPGKTHYLKKEWYRAILRLEEFLRKKGMDEDLVKEGSDMLSDAKEQLSSELGPLLGKARSLKEGQDLKAAYQAYLDVLKVEPTNSEALNEIDEIKNQLESRSKRIYREAIIAESLSLFGDAKEKFQEVQQISPTDSEYYNKATEKLKDYLE